MTLQRFSGGTQRSLGVFVQDIVTPTANLTLTLSARVDHWRNYNAHNLETQRPERRGRRRPMTRTCRTGATRSSARARRRWCASPIG